VAEQRLAGIDVGRYGRWLRRMGGGERHFAVVDAAGDTLWSDGDPGGFEQVCAALAACGFDWHCDGPGLQRRDVDDALTLLYHPIAGGPQRVLGWLAAVVERFEPQHAPIRIDELAEALEDVAAGIADQYRTGDELDVMAAELAARYEELHLVYGLDDELRRHGDTRNLFVSLLQTCADHMNADVAALVSADHEFRLSATNLSKPIHNLDLVLVEMRGDLFRFVSSAKQTIVLNDAKDPRRAYVFTDMPYKVMAYPILSGDAVIAMLVLLNHADKPDFSNSDRKLAEVLANQLSGLMRMYTMMTESARFNEQMAAALIEAVEAKDPYTRGHSERVHHLSMEIGRAMQLQDEDLDNLHWASLLHDVGKIGIPDAVLCKPGRLTPDEYTFIMVHPERSYEILRHIDRLRDAVPGARHHQEKWDGTGYPHGLKGNRIPLLARIIAVADTYDSITSSRAYRPGRSHEVALAEIDRVTGSQLDPTVVDVFKALCAAEPPWLAKFNVRRERQHA
jgi:HD-GYP domain-containing protein (c-di-GMP phosphodiesterase class II)